MKAFDNHWEEESAKYIFKGTVVLPQFSPIWRCDLTRVSVTQRTKHMSVFFVIISRQLAICHEEWRRNAPINKTTASVSVPFLFFSSPSLSSPLSFFLFSLQPDFAVSIAHTVLSRPFAGETRCNRTWRRRDCHLRVSPIGYHRLLCRQWSANRSDSSAV